MALWLDGDREFDTLPLGQYQASRGEYLAAVADDTWQGNPLPSLLRWHQRLRADYGEMGALARVVGPLYPGGRAAISGALETLGATEEQFTPRSRWLSLDEAHARGRELGLAIDRPMSEDAFESIAAERRKRIANDAVFERARLNGGYGPGLAIASVVAEFAVSAADPLNLATAFLPLARVPGLAGLVSRVPAGGLRRVATGAIEGGLGNLAVEPAVALAALDEDPNYGWTNPLLTLAFGAALGGGLHWLGGRFMDRAETPPRQRAPSARDVLEGKTAAEPPPAPRAEAVAARSETQPGEGPPIPSETLAAVPQRVAERIEAMHPETRSALYETALKQAGNDLSTDVQPIAQADRAWRPLTGADVAGGKPAYRLGGWDPSAIARELAEQRVLLEDLAAARAADPGRAFKAPAGWEPPAPLLKQAKAYVKAPTVGKEPESLAQFVRRKGGLDAGDVLAGDLRAQDLGRSGLLRQVKYQGVSTIRTAGRSFDEMAELAHEAGFFTERPTAEAFAAALADDAQGRKSFSTKGDQFDAAEFATRKADRAAWERWMAEHPLGDPRDMDPRDLAYMLSLDPVERRLAELDDLQSRGVISDQEAVERAALIDRALGSEEEAAARELLDSVKERPEGFEKDLEAARAPAEDAPLTQEDFNALAERSGLPEAPGEPLPPGDRGPGPAAGGQERGAPGALPQSAAAAADRALPGSGAEALQAQGRVSLEQPFDPAQFEAWIKRQGDWRADAHADPAASAKADALNEQRGTLTPEQDLADLEAITKRLLDDGTARGPTYPEPVPLGAPFEALSAFKQPMEFLYRQIYHRDLDLIGDVERMAADSLTASQIATRLRDRFEKAGIEYSDHRSAVIGIRDKLGIPSQATTEGKTEFAEWLKNYNQRQETIATEGPVQAELKATTAAYTEARTMVEAYAQCRLGGAGGE